MCLPVSEGGLDARAPSMLGDNGVHSPRTWVDGDQAHFRRHKERHSVARGFSVAVAGASVLRQAQLRFEAAARRLELSEAERELLGSPRLELHFRIPVRLDDGRPRIFSGFCILHSDALGPAKGGLRFHPQESADRVRALAMGMTWQSAALGLPLGGCAGGVICDPHGLGAHETEALARGWTRQAGAALGARRLVPGPDVMVGERELMWLLDELETLGGGRAPGAVAGKGLVLGGSRGCPQAAGYGLVYLLREALRERDLRLDAVRVSVQGYGTVARHAVQLLTQLGATVTCVSSWDAAAGAARAFVKPAGVDPRELEPITDRHGSIDAARAEALGYTVLPGDAWLEQEVEILLPAALEQQLREDNVARTHSALRLVVEGAGSAVSEGAAAALAARGVAVLPDLLANAGGLVCSYFEQVQGEVNYAWDADEVLGRLDLTLTSAYQAVSALAERARVDLREAALLLAVERVAAACRARRWV